MTRYRKCSAKDLQNRLQFINRHLETLSSIKRELLEESELRRETFQGQSQTLQGQSRTIQGQNQTIQEHPPTPPVFPSAPPALVRQIASLPKDLATRPLTPSPIKETTPTPEVPNPKGTESIPKGTESIPKGKESIAEPILQFLEDPTEVELELNKPEGVEDNISLASNEINTIEQELKESLEKLSLAKMKKTLSRSKPKII